MADSLVIVAIPDENDRVWKVSSEKVPHLTLLYLGEDVTQVAHVDQIVSFVEHAANTMLRRFNLSVDRRGELGADQADVIFFKKNHYDYKALWDFRAALLQDANIKTAYDSTTQFDGPWHPHLTLGYPAAPAQDETDDQGFYNVMFNKIAVWVTADDGPDFLLKDYWDEMGDMLETVPMDVAMSSLNHATKVSDTPWSNFKTSDYTDEQYARACLLDRGAEVEGKQRYAIPVREPSGALNRNGCHAAAAVLSSKGGTGSARGNKVKATPEQLAAAKRKLVALYNGPLNEDVPEGLKETMKQAIDVGAEFVLEHYGVKGMRWGMRRASAVTTQQHIDTGLLRRRTKIVAKGGASAPAHTDAVTAAVQKQVVKKSGTDALSTTQLRDLANRLQVENQVQILLSSKGKQFVRGELEREGKTALKRGAGAGAKAAAPHLIKRAGRGAATVATTAALL